MPTLNLGRVGFVNKGAYVDATTLAPHKVNDIVQLNSVTYVCIQYHETAHLPTDTLYWQKWTDYGIHSVSDISSVVTASADSQYVNYFAGTAGVSTGVMSLKLTDLVTATASNICNEYFEITITQDDQDLTLGTNPAIYKFMIKGDMKNGVWYNAQAATLGSSTVSPINVRFTRNATDAFIEIGETTSTWNYPIIEVSNLINNNTISYTPIFLASINGALLGTTSDFIISATPYYEETKGTDIASASTITIGTAGQGNLRHITGTTTITSLGDATAGTNRKLVFDGILTLTHNATSLILPDSANITTAVGDSAEFVCDSTNNWKLLRYTKATTPVVDGFCVCTFSNLKASANGTSSSVSVTADEIVVENSTNTYKTLRAVSLTIAGTSVGANGIDTGTISINTWYSLWVIWNGTTTSGLMSLSATAPTLPSGYTHKARVGWIRTDGTANKYPLSFTQIGRSIQYKVTTGSNVPNLSLMASGVLGTYSTPTWAAVAVGAFIPTTASKIKLLTNSVSGAMAIASNTSYGLYNSAINPPLIAGNGGQGLSSNFDMILESTNIYATSSTTMYIWAVGWEDNL